MIAAIQYPLRQSQIVLAVTAAKSAQRAFDKKRIPASVLGIWDSFQPEAWSLRGFIFRQARARLCDIAREAARGRARPCEGRARAARGHAKLCVARGRARATRHSIDKTISHIDQP